jgi:hypothetical protein
MVGTPLIPALRREKQMVFKLKTSLSVIDHLTPFLS